MSDDYESMEDIDVELPPALENFRNKLRQDRKMLLKDKKMGEPENLRQFIGQYLYPRLDTIMKMLGAASMDAYGLAMSNATQMQQLRNRMFDELDRLGADVDEDDFLSPPGVNMEVINDFQESFYAVGSLLKKKLPDDPEMEKIWNRCAETVSEMVAELMGVSSQGGGGGTSEGDNSSSQDEEQSASQSDDEGSGGESDGDKDDGSDDSNEEKSE